VIVVVVVTLDRSGCALYNKRIRKEVGIIVRANMHSTFVNIEDGSSRAIENVELFVSPKRLFGMWW
jgi:hypothetical protein